MNKHTLFLPLLALAIIFAGCGASAKSKPSKPEPSIQELVAENDALYSIQPLVPPVVKSGIRYSLIYVTNSGYVANQDGTPKARLLEVVIKVESDTGQKLAYSDNPYNFRLAYDRPLPYALDQWQGNKEVTRFADGTFKLTAALVDNAWWKPQMAAEKYVRPGAAPSAVFAGTPFEYETGLLRLQFTVHPEADIENATLTGFFKLAAPSREGLSAKYRN